MKKKGEMRCIPGRRGTLHHMEGFNTEQMRQLREIVVEVAQPIQATLDGHTRILERHSQTLDDNTSAIEVLGVSISNLDARMERGFAALAEDIAGVKSDIVAVDDRITAVESKISGIHNRIDDEAAQRNNLESRVRSAIANLPPRPEHV